MLEKNMKVSTRCRHFHVLLVSLVCTVIDMIDVIYSNTLSYHVIHTASLWRFRERKYFTQLTTAAPYLTKYTAESPSRSPSLATPHPTAAP